jgi:precorrin-6A/cobalt-precorrin-6A reductase
MKLLLLAGTAEARALAGRLVEDSRFEVVASLAGATQQAKPLPVPTRIGGFGGAPEQEEYIKDNHFDVVVDATHPFATQISDRSQKICAALDLPYLQLLRPGWQPGEGDDWRFISGSEEVADLLPQGARVFLATGRKTLEDYKNISDHTLYCRVVDPPETPFPYPDGGYITGRPPFSVESETELFRDLGITHLVVKDAGGVADAKFAAARALGIKVIVIERPPQPPGEKASTVEEALVWLEARL